MAALLDGAALRLGPMRSVCVSVCVPPNLSRSDQVCADFDLSFVVLDPSWLVSTKFAPSSTDIRRCSTDQTRAMLDQIWALSDHVLAIIRPMFEHELWWVKWGKGQDFWLGPDLRDNEW